MDAGYSPVSQPIRQSVASSRQLCLQSSAESFVPGCSAVRVVEQPTIKAKTTAEIKVMFFIIPLVKIIYQMQNRILNQFELNLHFVQLFPFFLLEIP